MSWQVGQKVVCDRPEQLLAGCFIQSEESDSVVITCPAVNLVISGKRKRLEELGWRLEDDYSIYGDEYRYKPN